MVEKVSGLLRTELVHSHQKSKKQPTRAWKASYLIILQKQRWQPEMVALAAGSFDYASFPELFKTQTVAGFFLEHAANPGPMPEGLCGGYLGSAWSQALQILSSASRLRETPLGATWYWLTHDVSSLPTLRLVWQNFVIHNYNFLFVYSPLLRSLVFFPKEKQNPQIWIFSHIALLFPNIRPTLTGNHAEITVKLLWTDFSDDTRISTVKLIQKKNLWIG